jgi:hypothetical protein
VIEKYKKKLDDAAAVRRELKVSFYVDVDSEERLTTQNAEEENAHLLTLNNSLEDEVRKLGNGKADNGTYKDQLAVLDRKAAQQAADVSPVASHS